MENDRHIVVTKPVHQQLVKACLAEIGSGAFRPEDRFLSGRDIAQKFGVNRSTANKAISQMVAEGILTLKPGIGTFVSSMRGLHTSLRQMESFTDVALSAGMGAKNAGLFLLKEPGQQPT